MLDSDAGLATWLSTRSLSAADADQRWVSGRGRGKSHWLFAPCLRIDSSANQDRKSFIISPEAAEAEQAGISPDFLPSSLLFQQLTFDERRCKRSPRRGGS